MGKVGMPILLLKQGNGKTKRSGNAKAVALEALEERYSSDPDLDRTKTKDNIYMDGGFRSGIALSEYWRKQAEAFRVIDKNGKEKKLRSDASIAFANILKPDKEFMDSLTSEQQMIFLNDLIDITKEAYTKQGIKVDTTVIQVDEGNPHVHLFGHDPQYKLGKKLNLKFFNVLNREIPKQLRGLHNKAYIGVYKYDDIVIENGIPALVSKELFEQVQEMFALNKRKGAQIAAELADYEAPRYWLTGKLFCGHCGESMQGVSGTSKTGKKHYYYYCSGQRKHKCDKHPIRTDIIEKAVEDILHDILANSENAIKIADAAVDYYNTHYNDTSYIDSLEAALQETQKSLDNLVKAIELGIFSETTQQRLTELENRKKSIRDSIEAERTKRKLMDDKHSISAYFNWFNDPASFLFDPSVRDVALDYFIHKIYVYDSRIIITGSFFDNLGETNMCDIPLEALDDDIEFDPLAVSSTKKSTS